MNWLWTTWCLWAWGWNVRTSSFTENVGLPICIAVFVAIVVHTVLVDSRDSHIPKGAKRTVALLIGSGVGAVWPAALGAVALAASLIAVAGVAGWLWETVRDTGQYAVQLHGRFRKKSGTIPPAKVVKQ